MDVTLLVCICGVLMAALMLKDRQHRQDRAEWNKQVHEFALMAMCKHVGQWALAKPISQAQEVTQGLLERFEDQMNTPTPETPATPPTPEHARRQKKYAEQGEQPIPEMFLEDQGQGIY